MDYISKLPEHIISAILNKLTWVEAVQTSLLSTRWRYLWVLRRDLNLDIPNMFGDDHWLIQQYEMSTSEEDHHTLVCIFVKRVAQFLMSFYCARMHYWSMTDPTISLFTAMKIDSLTVSFPLDGSSISKNAIYCWTVSAILMGAESLELHLLGTSNEAYKFPYLLFSGLSTPHLKHLYLQTCELRPPPDFIGLRQLMTLHINTLLVEEGLVECILSACVLLEGLTLSYCKFTSEKLKIASLSLCKLKLIESWDIPSLEIAAPRLCDFEYSGDVAGKASSIEAPCLTNMFMHVMEAEDKDPYGLKIIKKVSHLESLHLLVELDNILDKVQRVPSNRSAFRNLMKLELTILRQMGVDNELDDLLWVLAILEAAPALQKLVLRCFGVFWMDLSETQREIRRPSAFSHSQLKEVEIGGCIGNWCEIEFAMSILKNVPTLKKLVMNGFNSNYDGNGEWVHSGESPSWLESEAQKVCQLLESEVPNGVQFDVL